MSLRRSLSRPDQVRALTAAAMIAGGVLRLAALDSIPPGLSQDEAMNGYDAYSLFLTGRDHHGHPFPFVALESFGDWVSPLLTFVSIPAVGLLGLDVVVVRGVSAALGVLAIPAVYVLGVELFRRQSIGVVAAWIVALSPWHVHLVRWAIPPSIVPTMLALTMLLFLGAVRRQSSRGMVAASLSAALTVASYPTMKLYVPLLAVVALLLYWKQLRRIKREPLVYAAAVFVLVAGPIYYLSILDPAGRARLEQVSVLRRDDISVRFLTAQYASYFSPAFLFLRGDGDPMHTPLGFGVELRAMAPLLLAGLAYTLYVAARPPLHESRLSAMFLLAAVALYAAPGSLTRPSPHTLRAAHLIPLGAVIAGAGAVTLVGLLRRSLRRAVPRAPDVVLALVLALITVPGAWELVTRYRHYFTDYPREVTDRFQHGLVEALAYAREHQDEYDEIWVTAKGDRYISDERAAPWLAVTSYIFVLYEARFPPSEVHRTLAVRRAPPWFNEVPAFGKYRFGLLPDAGVVSPTLSLLKTATYPDGSVAYQVSGGRTPAGQRLLWIRRP